MALAVQLHEHYAIIASDGVEVAGRNAIIKCIRSPILCMPQLNAALVVVGSRGLAEFINMHTPPHVTGFDALVAALPSMISSALHAVHTRDFALDEASPRNIVVTGWSESAQKFVAYEVSGHDLSARARDACNTVKMRRIPAGKIWSNFALDSNTRALTGLDQGTGDDDDYNRLIRQIFAARIRYALSPDPIAAGTPVAGGFIKLAIVSRDLHRIWIPHRWEEDRVGATLDPDPAERLPEQFCAVHPSFAAGKRR